MKGPHPESRAADGDSKKMDRVMRNRMSARRSREQAKNHVRLLQQNIALLTEHSNALATRLAMVETENMRLRQRECERQYGHQDKAWQETSLEDKNESQNQPRIADWQGHKEIPREDCEPAVDAPLSLLVSQPFYPCYCHASFSASSAQRGDAGRLSPVCAARCGWSPSASAEKGASFSSQDQTLVLSPSPSASALPELVDDDHAPAKAITTDPKHNFSGLAPDADSARSGPMALTAIEPYSPQAHDPLPQNELELAELLLEPPVLLDSTPSLDGMDGVDNLWTHFP